MKALTLNIHSHSREHCEHDYHHMICTFSSYIISQKIDVIAIQESCQTCTKKQVMKEELSSFIPCQEGITITEDNCAWLIIKEAEKKGVKFYWTWCPAKLGYNKYDEGLAILSRYPILLTETDYISKSHDFYNWKTRKIVGCKILIGSKIQWFYSLHMGWWKDEEENFIFQMQRVQKLVETKKENVFLMGDFNSPSHVRGEGYDYIKSNHWKDTYEIAQEKDDGITVPGKIDGWEQGVDRGMRIDYIWSRQPVPVASSKVMFSGNTEPVISDHFGVCITII